MLPKIQKILYTTDLGPDAPYVFRHALSLAREYQAKIIAVHSMEPLSGFGKVLVEQYVSSEITEERHKQAREHVKEQLEERMKNLCARECNNVSACETSVESIQVLEGYPEEVIMRLAKEYSVDLIVMGAHRRNIVGEVILGSTTRRVLHMATQPVLVVKIPEGYTEET